MTLELNCQVQILTLLLLSCVILDKFLESLGLTGTKVHTVASYPVPRNGTSYFLLPDPISLQRLGRTWS